VSLIADIRQIESAGVSSGRFVDALTGLRGLAALWVMVFHLWLVFDGAPPVFIKIAQWSIDLTPFFSCGWVGVNLFFGLSGFLLFLPFAQILLGLREKVYLGEYFKRRFLRLVPAYYLQIAILFLLSLVGMHGPVSAKIFIAHLLMLQDFFPDQLMNGVYWTLPVELSFYLLLPSLFFLLQRTGWFYFILTMLFVVFFYRTLVFFLMQSVDARNIKAIAMGQLPGRLDDFVFGMWSAYLYTRYGFFISNKIRFLGSIGICISIFGIIVMIYWFYLSDPGNYWSGEKNLVFFWNTIVAIFIATLIFSLALNGWLARTIFSNKIVFFLGIISYSLYLWHLVVISWLMEYFQSYVGYKSSILWMIGITLSVAISVISYWCIERPFLKIRHGIRSELT